MRADRASASPRPRAGFTLRLSEAELRSRRARRARWRAPPLMACVGMGRAGAPWGFGKSAAEIISGIAAAPVVGVDDRGARAAAPEAAAVPVDPPTAESSRKPRRAQPTYNGLRLLPLWEAKPGGEPRQYCLDRGIVRLLLPEEQDAIKHREGTASSGTDPQRRGGHHGKVNTAAVQFRRMERTAVRARNSLFPARESVTEDYWEYAKFRFLQRMASSCITVFATQQMLAAIGMGASRRLPAAAAINWVLKDGLGRLGKLGVAANFGREFDSDVKRFRFTSSVVYDASSSGRLCRRGGTEGRRESERRHLLSGRLGGVRERCNIIRTPLMMNELVAPRALAASPRGTQPRPTVMDQKARDTRRNRLYGLAFTLTCFVAGTGASRRRSSLARRPLSPRLGDTHRHPRVSRS